MKKNYWMAGALVCALTVAATGCSNEELDGKTPDGKGQRATITASIPQNGANTRISYDETDASKVKLAWEAADAIGIWKAGESTVNEFTTAAAGANVNFTSTTSVSFNADNQLYAVYPKPTTVTGNAVTLDLSISQSGTMNNAYHYMYAAAQWQDNTANFNFTHAVAVLKLMLNFTTGAPTELTKVTLAATGLHNKATLTMSGTPTIAGTVGGDIIAEGTFGVANPVYLYIFPETLSDIKITATDGTKTYEGTLTNSTAVAGKVYTATVTMSEATATVNFITVNGIDVAVGNLVADGPNGAKIGAATDNGLYFQFGSLIGWSETGTATIAVKPSDCTVTSWNSSWTATNDLSADPDNKDEVAGTGDPCRYYLKGTWRLPTKTEFETLFNTQDNSYKNGWSWDASSSSASYSSSLKIPASGFRSNINGNLDSVGSFGYYWSASLCGDDAGYCLVFFDSNAIPGGYGIQMNGLPVRCVKGSN